MYFFMFNSEEHALEIVYWKLPLPPDKKHPLKVLCPICRPIQWKGYISTAFER